MSSYSIKQLLEGHVSESVDLSVDLIGAVVIGGIEQDSRSVTEGDLFLACDGENVHGEKFISAAVDAGAVAIALETTDLQKAKNLSKQLGLPVIPVENLTQKLGCIAAKFFNNPTSKLKVVGITGTNGKTSCSHILSQCLTRLQQPCGVIGTLGAGLWGHLEKINNTTPGALELQSRLEKMVNAGATTAILEVSSHGLVQGRLNGCEFEVAVFTNLTQDHLDYHGSMENYGQAKLGLFTDKTVKKVVVNLDDAFSQVILDEISVNVSAIAITFNSETMLNSETAVIVGRILTADTEGMLISINSPFGQSEIRTSLMGRFNASNLLIVLACALQLGEKFEEICKTLRHVKAPEGRLEKFGGKDQPLIVIDYAHTPDALSQVLSTLRDHASGKLLVLLGCGGDRDKSKRSKMGAIAEDKADVVWLTNDNPRTESPIAIVDDILKGVTSPDKISIELDRASAIRGVVAAAKTSDIVLIAGKGHETYQIIGDQHFDFSDRKIVTEILNEIAA